MPNNLKQKLALVLEDCENRPRYELLQRLERVVLEEVGFLAGEHSVDNHDLTVLQSRATDIHNKKRLDQESLGRIHGDGGAIRALCFMEATVEYFRSKGMVNFTVLYNKK